MTLEVTRDSLCTTDSMEALLRSVAWVEERSFDDGSDALAPGDTLCDGRFVIRERIGRGGMGVVYAADDTNLGAPVALKTLRTRRPDLIVRLKHEFRALRDVHHPHLVRRGELLEDSGRWFFTMELIRGAPLLDVVRDDRPALRRCLSALAAALDTMHAAGVVHRDIKPGNMLVAEDGRLVLLDFGLAQAMDLPARERSVGGTRGYVPPEVVAGGTFEPAGDMYAVGVVLHEALTGRLPASDEAIEPAGDALAAICAELLSPDPTARPSAASLLQRLDGRQTVSRSVGVTFVGRHAELRALDAALAEAHAAGRGTSRAVVVVGPSGLGKSHLVEHFFERAAHRSSDAADHRPLLVLSGRCYESESVPFKTLDGVIEALGHHLRSLSFRQLTALQPRYAPTLVRAFPALAGLWPSRSAFGEDSAGEDSAGEDSVGPRALRRQLNESIPDLFRAIAAQSRLVIAIDDLQWADAEGLALLHEVCTGIGDHGLLLVATSRVSPGDRFRAVDAGPGVDAAPDLSAFARSTVLPLEPLSPADAQALAEAHVAKAGLQPGVARALAEVSEGLPFFITELVQHVGAGAQAPPGPGELSAAIGARAGRCAPAGRQLLKLLVIGGVPIERSVLRWAAGQDVVQFEEGVAELASERWVVSSGPGPNDHVEVRHDRIRETLHARLVTDERRALHRVMAETLAEHRPDAWERRARHHVGAEQPIPARDCAVRAAEQAEAGYAYEHAASLYRLALSQDHALVDAKRAALEARLGGALAAASRALDAGEAFSRAAALATGEEARLWRRRAGEQLLVGGAVVRGRELLVEDMTAIGMARKRNLAQDLIALLWERLLLWLRRGRLALPPAASDPASTSEIDLLWAAGSPLSLVDGTYALRIQTRGLRRAMASGDTVRTQRSLALEVCVLSLTGNLAAARRQLERCRSLSPFVDDSHAATMVRSAEMMCALRAGDWDTTERLVDENERLFRETVHGTPWEIANSIVFGLSGTWAQGRLARLRQKHAVSAEDAAHRRDAYLQLGLDVSATPLVALMDDDPDHAAAVMASVPGRLVPGAVGMFVSLALIRQCQTLIYAGQPEAALAALEARESIGAWAFGRRSSIANEWLRYTRLTALLLATRAKGPTWRQRWLLAYDIRTLRRSPDASIRAMGRLAYALARVFAGRSDAPSALAQARGELLACDMNAMAAAAGRAIGLLTGDEAAIRAADAWFADETVTNPARFAALLAPLPNPSNHPPRTLAPTTS